MKDFYSTLEKFTNIIPFVCCEDFNANTPFWVKFAQRR